jgi:hypothetical protein
MKIPFLILFVILVGCSQVKVAETPPVIQSEPVDVFNQVYFSTERKELWVQQAVRDANCVASLKSFVEEVKSIGWFAYSGDTGEQVAQRFFNSSVTKVDLHTFLNPWTSVTATTFSGNTETVFLNSRLNKRKRSAYVASLIHERSHLPMGGGYTHPSNHTINRPSSVSYKLGEIAAKHAAKCF